MRVNTYKFPSSHFLAVEKDYALIIQNFEQNERLKKLLYYSYKDALNRPNLTQEQTQELFENNIRIVPNYNISSKERSYVIAQYIHFTGDETDFKQALLIFDIIVHLDNEMLDDFKIRSYKIASEIHEMMKQKQLTNMGLAAVDVQMSVIDEEFVNLTMMYGLVHMSEDNKRALTPKETQSLKSNFEALYNNK